MSVPYSRYDQVAHTTFGTVLTASGTVVVAPTNGSRLMFDHLTYWLVDPAGSNTVTLTVGATVMPPFGLSSARTGLSHGPMVLPAETPVTAVLAGAGSVGFYGSYVIATNS